jgi:hypothetical protein
MRCSRRPFFTRATLLQFPRHAGWWFTGGITVGRVLYGERIFAILDWTAGSNFCCRDITGSTSAAENSVVVGWFR